MTFGERLRSAREGAGLTQVAAAKLAGFHAVSWNKWERGKSTPSELAVFKRLSDALGVRYLWLADGDGKMVDRRKRVTP